MEGINKRAYTDPKTEAFRLDCALTEWRQMLDNRGLLDSNDASRDRPYGKCKVRHKSISLAQEFDDDGLRFEYDHEWDHRSCCVAVHARYGLPLAAALYKLHRGLF